MTRAGGSPRPRGGLRKLRHRGTPLVDWLVTFAAAAYNLVRLLLVSVWAATSTR